MSITFGSVGDIIAVCGIVRSLAQALDDIKGSSAEYRAVVNQLNSLEEALDKVKSLSGTFSPHQQNVFRQCLSSAEQCHHIVAPFLDGIKKYREHFEEGSSSNSFEKALYKARWHYSQRDAVAKLRSELQAHTSAILINLSTTNLSVAKDQDQRLGLHHVALQKACSEQTNNANDIRSHLATSISLFEESKSFFKHVSEGFGLQQVHKLVTDIRDVVRRSLTISFATYQAVLRLEARTTSIERPFIGEPWVFEDPLGRLSPVHMDFVNSWEAFHAVLSARFRSLPGYSKIENGEYILEEPGTGVDVDLDLPWDVAFVPGRRYAMSMLFMNSELDQKATETSCPRCFSVSNMSVTSNIVWYPTLRRAGLIIEEPLANTRSSSTCGTSYRRITEMADTQDVDTIKPTNNGPEKQRRPGKYANTQDKGKKRKATEPSGQICDQIHQFKRVRVIKLEMPSIPHNSELAPGGELSCPYTKHAPNKISESPTGTRSIFSSAIPMLDSPTDTRDDVLEQDVGEDKVLFLAASLFEFNIAHDRREAGFSYLVYVPGEVFDVLGMRGELWLARNQDDPSGTVGWIWEKHFARIFPE